jgi:hypothetical protein
VALGIAFVVGALVPVDRANAQTAPAARPSTAAAKPAGVARTPWGDPDLQGTYSNSNESGIPLERPAELAGKRLEDVTPAELDRIMKQRHQRQEQTARTIGGSEDNDTGAGPPAWYENYNAKNSRAWMISDPPDGLRPAVTDEARQRAQAVQAARRGGDGTTPDRSMAGGPDALRSLHHSWSARLDDAGDLRNSYQIVQGPAGWRFAMRWSTRPG